eukprot:13143047-Alexandrium_andersonii.AAC.1
MKQAYGRDAWNYPELHKNPLKRNEPLDGVYTFDVGLLDLLGEPFRWGSLFVAIQKLHKAELAAQAPAAAS